MFPQSLQASTGANLTLEALPLAVMAKTASTVATTTCPRLPQPLVSSRWVLASFSTVATPPHGEGRHEGMTTTTRTTVPAVAV